MNRLGLASTTLGHRNARLPETLSLNAESER